MMSSDEESQEASLEFVSFSSTKRLLGEELFR